MPALVNSDYGDDARQKGATVDVPIPSAIAAVAVTPAATPPSTADSTPTSVSLPLDQWWEAPFYLTDKDRKQADAGFIPMQVSEAIKALANKVNTYIFTEMYKGIYGYAGVAATTPFASDTSNATDLRKILNKQLAPEGDRRVVLDPDAEANALNLRPFNDMSFSGNPSAIIEGKLNRKFGFDWFMSQLIPTHTAGTAASATTDNTGYAAGLKTVTLASAGTGTILVGDVITFAGHTQTYVITSGDADVSNGGTISFYPGLAVALSAATKAITVKATHVANLAFHRDCFAFATRPLEDDVPAGLGSIVQAAFDPKSGLTLRLEITREHKRIRWSFDILYGGVVVRREFGCRLAG